MPASRQKEFGVGLRGLRFLLLGEKDCFFRRSRLLTLSALFFTCFLLLRCLIAEFLCSVSATGSVDFSSSSSSIYSVLRFWADVSVAFTSSTDLCFDISSNNGSIFSDSPWTFAPYLFRLVSAVVASFLPNSPRIPPPLWLQLGLWSSHLHRLHRLHRHF